MFDDEHGVALVAQVQQQVVHALDVVRVQADGGFVEDVGDVGEGGAEVADHLDALGLAAGEGAGGAVEGEVAEADLDEGVEGAVAGWSAAGRRRFVEVADPGGEVADLHGAGVGDGDAGDLGAAGAALRRVPSQSGQVVKVTARSTKARMWGCMLSTSLDSMDFWILGMRPS
ncbi:hypothetical protein GCM10020358_84960 [Amorphoplanes nipponensis]